MPTLGEFAESVTAFFGQGPPAFDGPESLGMAGVAPAISDGMPSSLRPTANMDPNGANLKDGISGTLEGEARDGDGVGIEWDFF